MRGLGQIVGLVVIVAGIFSGLGCAAVPKNGDLSLVQTASNEPRAGNVYLLRGWIGVFSRGIDDLGDKLEQQGVRTVVFQADQWGDVAQAIEAKYSKVPLSSPSREPLVLVGHSYGADNVVRISRELRDKGIAVDLLITLDPVTPPNVPGNVARTVNIYQSNGVADALPFLRGIPLTPETPAVQIANLNVRTDRKDLMAGEHVDHFNIEKKPAIHQEVIRQVETVCLPRTQWLALRNTNATDGAQLASSTFGPARPTAAAGVQPAAKPAPTAPVAANTISSPKPENVSAKAASYGGAVKPSSDPWSKGGQ